MNIIRTQSKDDKMLVDAHATSTEVEAAFEAAYASFAHQMKLAPEDGATVQEAARNKLAIKDLDSRVRADVIEYLIPFAVDASGAIPAFPPSAIKQGILSKGKELDFTIEITPKHVEELSSYENIEVEVPSFEMDDAQLDDQLRQMAESYADFVSIDPRPTRDGDGCLVNIDAVRNETRVAELCKDKVVYTIGENALGASFDEQIIGMNVGDTKRFEIPGLDVDGDPDPVEFSVEVLDIRERVVPVIDDAWLEKNVPRAGGLENFKDLIRRQFSASYRQEYEDLKRQLAVEKLAERYEGAIGDEAIVAMRSTIMNGLTMKLDSEGTSLEDYIAQNGGKDQFGFSMTMQAKNALKQAYALDALYRHQNLSIDDDDILAACKTLNDSDPEAVRRQMENTGCGYMLRETAERMKASQWLVDNACSVKYVKSAA